MLSFRLGVADGLRKLAAPPTAALMEAIQAAEAGGNAISKSQVKAAITALQNKPVNPIVGGAKGVWKQIGWPLKFGTLAALPAAAMMYAMMRAKSEEEEAKQRQFANYQ